LCEDFILQGCDAGGGFDKSRVAQEKEIGLRIFCGKAVNTSCCGARRKRAGCLGGKQRKRVVASW